MVECKIGVLGSPKFKYGDVVGFYLRPYKETKEKFFIGTVYIVDSYGTFEQSFEPSYDIMVENYNGMNERCLIKHIRESHLYYDLD